MYYFCIPSDFNCKTLDKISQMNAQSNKFNVYEVYGQITEGEFIGSGRMTSMLPKINIKELEVYINYCRKENIYFNYVFNPSCMGNIEFNKEEISRIKDFITSLYEIGVDSMTVALPSIMELINSLNLKIKIKASAICEINSVHKAVFYKNLADRIVIDPDITRKFDIIGNICDTFDSKVEIIVNNVCMRNCPYKMFHYNHESHCHNNNTEDETNYYFHRCAMQKAGDIGNMLKLNWIRPEDLHYYYRKGVKYFKLQGRQNTNGDNLLKAIQFYFDENYDGDLLELITLFSPYNSFQLKLDNKKLDGYIDRFYNNKNLCNEVCHECNYCSEFIAKSMNVDESISINDRALNFYRKYDQYLK